MWHGPRGKTFAATTNAAQESRVASSGRRIGRRFKKFSDRLATRIKNKCDPDACPSNAVKLTVATISTPRNQAPARGPGQRWNKGVTAHRAAFARFKPIAIAYARASSTE